MRNASTAASVEAGRLIAIFAALFIPNSYHKYDSRVQPHAGAVLTEPTRRARGVQRSLGPWHLALHSFFAEHRRPVPRILFLDQASQIGYPPDREINPSAAEDERQRVVRLFKVVFETVRKIAPDFQVVITEHADLTEDWYRAAVVERWRNGEALIPADWDTPAG